MKQVWCMLITACCGMMLAACANATATPIGDAKNGEQLFNTGGASQVPCVTCHALDGSTLVGPTLKGIALHAGERAEGVSAEDYLRQSIIQPSAYIVPGFSDSMYKNYAQRLSEDDVNDLIAFLLTQN